MSMQKIKVRSQWSRSESSKPHISVSGSERLNSHMMIKWCTMPILFADDTNLFCTGKNLGDIVNEINVEIDRIYSWVKANKLSLNVEKTNFMLFTPKCFPRIMDDLLINGNRISEVNETKFLGVIIDNKLNWSPHIMHISKKIAKGIGIILKARKVFDNVTLFSL